MAVCSESERSIASEVEYQVLDIVKVLSGPTYFGFPACDGEIVEKDYSGELRHDSMYLGP